MRLTTAQEKFLVELLIDCEMYDPKVVRLDYLTERCGRDIKFVDEVSIGEAKRIITELIERRDRLRKNRKPLEEQESLF